MTDIGDWLDTATTQLMADCALERAAARRDAEQLLMLALDCARSHLFGHPEATLPHRQERRAQYLLARRRAGEPLAYLRGHQAFWEAEFTVNAHTLIPRPDSECLVALALDTMPANADLVVADLGTGSGCLAISLATARPRWRIVAVERSWPALQVAAANAKRLCATRVYCVCGDWARSLRSRSLDLLVANPPYLRIDDPHLADLQHEPRTALVSGVDGLDDITQIGTQATRVLVPGGRLLIEIGYDQGDLVVKRLRDLGFDDVALHRDLGGRTRVASAQWH